MNVFSCIQENMSLPSWLRLPWGGRPSPGEQDLFAYPWDEFNLKSLAIDLKQFEKLDAYAQKLNAKGSLKRLVRDLLQEAHSDLEKVRAIWMWICHHIEYDIDRISIEPPVVLQSGKTFCSGYAVLFHKMCSIAGIKSEIITGYSKRCFKEDKGTHAWNVVFISARWHLLDCTWGSGGMNEDRFIFRYNEFYFLTHPAIFINCHFPMESKWQLLKQTLRWQQFVQNMCHQPEFFSAGLISASPNVSVLSTDNGKATVLIESHSPTFFQCQMNGIEANCLIMLQRNGLKLEVYPQETGIHKLQISAEPFKDDKITTYTNVLEYALNCSSVNKNMCLPPKLINPVGPSWYSEENGILNALPTSPIIHTDDGRCIVTFTRSQELEFFAKLDSEIHIVHEKMRARHICISCQGDLVKLRIRLPSAGNFALHIWTKKKSDPGRYHCALTYLISCQNQNVKWPVFPRYFTNWDDNELMELGYCPATD